MKQLLCALGLVGLVAVAAPAMAAYNLEVPVEDRIGEEGKGFQYILDGLNPEQRQAANAVGQGAQLRAVVRLAFGDLC
mgnify:CR=1 FL=1